MVSPDDNCLVLGCQQGDREAFEKLIRQHQRMIHSLCFRMTGALADAEDLAQETFIQAYRHIESFRSQASFSSWLYRIAMNLCLNWQKSQARRHRNEEQWSEQQTGSAPRDDSRSQAVQDGMWNQKAGSI